MRQDATLYPSALNGKLFLEPSAEFNAILVDYIELSLSDALKPGLTRGWLDGFIQHE